jgi:hypothetical protein
VRRARAQRRSGQPVEPLRGSLLRCWFVVMLGR